MSLLCQWKVHFGGGSQEKFPPKHKPFPMSFTVPTCRRNKGKVYNQWLYLIFLSCDVRINCYTRGNEERQPFAHNSQNPICETRPIFHQECKISNVMNVDYCLKSWMLPFIFPKKTYNVKQLIALSVTRE